MTHGPKVKLVSAHIQKNCFPDESEEEILAKSIEDLDDESVFTKLVKNYHRTLISRDPTTVETFFMNRYGVRYLFRGVILPLSDDGENIDFIWCVLNWKEDIPGSIADLNELHDKIMGREENDLQPDADISTAEDDGVRTLSSSQEELKGFTENDETPDLEDQIEDDVMSDLLSGEYNPDQLAETPVLSEKELVPDDDPPEDIEQEDIEQEDRQAIDAVMDDIEIELDDQDPPEPPSPVGDEQENTTPSAVERLKSKLAGIAGGPAISVAKEPEQTTENVAGVDEVAEPEADEDEAFEEETPAVQKMPEEPKGPEDTSEDAGHDPGQNLAGNNAALLEVLEETRKAASRVARVNSKTRHGLYRVLEGAYKLFAVSRNQQEAYQQLLSKYDLKEQARAPFTPVMKLIFGKTYDKTRLTEYAAAISWAWRNDVALDDVSDFISNHPGGIKGCVKAERREKRKLSGKTVDLVADAKKQLQQHDIIAETNIDASDKDDFVLLLARKNDQQKLDVIKIVDEAPTTLDAIIKKATTTAK